MAESITQKRIIKWIREQGQYAVNIHGHEMQERGIADILCCWDGLFVAIEVKEPGEEPEPIQQYHMEQVAKANGYAFVAHSLDEVKEGIHQIEEIVRGKVAKIMTPIRTPSQN